QGIYTAGAVIPTDTNTDPYRLSFYDYEPHHNPYFKNGQILLIEQQTIDVNIEYFLHFIVDQNFMPPTSNSSEPCAGSFALLDRSGSYITDLSSSTLIKVIESGNRNMQSY